MRKAAVTLATVVLLAACNKSEQPVNEPVAAKPAVPSTTTTASAAVPQTAPATVQANATPSPVAAPAGMLAGTIVETMDAGGYTYMRIKTADGDPWVATPQTKVRKGQRVSIAPQMTAEKFRSSTLNRTFDRIVFGTLAGTNAPVATQASALGMPPANMPREMPTNMSSAMGTPADHMKPRVEIEGGVAVPKADDAKAKTVSEVWAARAALADKEVVIRAKVVKFLGGIMGTNFLHVRDGSGSDANGDNDLAVTTSENASIGDVVVIRGVVHVDKDFGAGYRYPVIIENASLQK